MEILDIALIVIGLLFVVISYALTEKIDSIQGKAVKEGQALWTDKDEQLIMEHMHEKMEEKYDSIVEQAREEMAEISNEKIMAVSDYSQQILEKIEQNHKEVVFLYDMLEKKKTEMKEIVQTKEEIVSTSPAKKVVPVSKPTTRTHNNRKSKKPTINATERSIATPSSLNAKNQQILELSQKGKSVLEISKQLGIGQGEVKLVIDLYANQAQ